MAPWTSRAGSCVVPTVTRRNPNFRSVKTSASGFGARGMATPGSTVNVTGARSYPGSVAVTEYVPGRISRLPGGPVTSVPCDESDQTTVAVVEPDGTTADSESWPTPGGADRTENRTLRAASSRAVPVRTGT